MQLLLRVAPEAKSMETVTDEASSLEYEDGESELKADTKGNIKYRQKELDLNGTGFNTWAAETTQF